MSRSEQKAQYRDGLNILRAIANPRVHGIVHQVFDREKIDPRRLDTIQLRMHGLPQTKIDDIFDYLGGWALHDRAQRERRSNSANSIALAERDIQLSSRQVGSDERKMHHVITGNLLRLRHDAWQSMLPAWMTPATRHYVLSAADQSERERRTVQLLDPNMCVEVHDHVDEHIGQIYKIPGNYLIKQNLHDVAANNLNQVATIADQLGKYGLVEAVIPALLAGIAVDQNVLKRNPITAAKVAVLQAYGGAVVVPSRWARGQTRYENQNNWGAIDIHPDHGITGIRQLAGGLDPTAHVYQIDEPGWLIEPGPVDAGSAFLPDKICIGRLNEAYGGNLDYYDLAETALDRVFASYLLLHPKDANAYGYEAEVIPGLWDRRPL